MLQKTIATCFVFLFILCNNSFAQISSGTFSDNSKPEIVWQDNGIGTINQITSVNGDQYGIRSTQVYKLDSSGHTVWIRNFSQPINSSVSYPTVLGGLVFNNGKLFIQELQGPTTTTPGDYYPAIIVMDTSGQILNINCNFFQAGRFYQIGGFRAANSGAWFMYKYSSGINSVIFIIKTDSLGNWDLTVQSPMLQYYSDLQLTQICALSDSTYLAFSNVIMLNATQVPEYMACAKFKDNGRFMWNTGFYDFNYTGSLHTTIVETSTVDSSGNIYMMGKYYKNLNPNSINYTVAVRLDRNGIVELCKFWPQFPAISFHGLAYKDTMLNAFISYNSTWTKIVMDTAFNNPCLGPDSAIELYNAGGAGPSYGSGINYPIPVSYIPGIDTGQITISPPLIYPDFCNLVNSIPNPIELPENDFIIYPNPVNTTFNLVSTEQSGTLINLELFTLTGMLVLNKNCIQENTITVDVTQFRSGFYILKIETDKRPVYRKIYIQSDN